MIQEKNVGKGWLLKWPWDAPHHLQAQQTMMPFSRQHLHSGFMVREMWRAVASGRAVRRELFEEADI